MFVERVGPDAYTETVGRTPVEEVLLLACTEQAERVPPTSIAATADDMPMAPVFVGQE
jgi:hypothetical protein